MSIVSLRFNEKEEKILKEFASFENLGLSTYIKKILFERLEDEYDLKLFENAWQEHIETGNKTYSLEDIAKENGIDL